MSEKQQYINFDEYIRQGEPSKREAAYAWSTAIGLQAVDGLKTSEYLNDLARRNIEGEYKSIVKDVELSPVYLERFFRNLLLGEQWDLRNRYLHIHPTKEWSAQPNLANPTSIPASTPASTPQVPDKLPEQAPDKLPDKFSTDNLYIKRLVEVVGYNEVTIKDTLKVLGLKDRESFMNVYLNPALKERFVRMKYPDKPHHPRQKYLLTVKGLALYKELQNYV